MTSAEPDKHEPSLRTVLHACSRENWDVARVWLYYTLFYWLLPTLIVIFGLYVGKRDVKWMDLVVHGEFLIYAITLTATSTRLIARDVAGHQPFIKRQLFNLLAQVMIFPAIFTYGLVRYIGLTLNPDAVSKPIVVSYSIVLLVVAFGFSFLVFLIDAQRSSTDLARRVAATIAHEPDKLNADFDALQTKAATGGDGGASVAFAPTVESEPVSDPTPERLSGDFDRLEGGK